MTANTHINSLLKRYPECEEYLYPFLNAIDENTTISDLADKTGTSQNALISGLKRYLKRIEQYPCNYEKMHRQLIKPGMINIAGFTNFLLQDALTDELKTVAQEKNIPLNLNIFPKHEKKRFQNYLTICNSPEDLPDILIGKGFSSLTTSRFFDRFIHPGHFTRSLDNTMNGHFMQVGLPDNMQAYHPFGVEEEIMVFDKSIDASLPVPGSWKDILSEQYKGALTQMGKPGQDHFGFIMMLYLFNEYGKEGIEQFASNVKSKQHFTQTIRNIGRKSDQVAPVNVMHSFAARFIRSEAANTVQTIETPEGNPAVCHFFLLKREASGDAEYLSKHLFSNKVQQLMEKCGITPVASENKKNIRWIGWDTLRELPLPYLKDYLSEIVFNNYKKIRA